MSPEQRRVLVPLLDAFKQCVFPTATKLALQSNEPADVIRQAALATCSRQHDALAEGFKRSGATETEIIRDIDTFVDGQILRAVLSTRAKSAGEAADDAYARGDYSTALKLFRPLAEGGDPIAETRLGQMYFSGDGVPEDFTEAAKWLTLGANHGDDAAKASLGVMYFLGRGVPKDFVLSYMWSSLAAANGLQEAEKVRDGIARLMTPDQIADAQKRAREWAPNRPTTTK
jgi:hypothetical protein